MISLQSKDVQVLTLPAHPGKLVCADGASVMVHIWEESARVCYKH